MCPLSGLPLGGSSSLLLELYVGPRLPGPTLVSRPSVRLALLSNASRTFGVTDALGPRWVINERLFAPRRFQSNLRVANKWGRS
jgi:hypothetical protein